MSLVIPQRRFGLLDPGLHLVDPANPLTGDPLNDGLVFWWKGLPSKTGGITAFDLSGYGNHGTLTNMDPATDWVAGPRGGRALDFDGVNDYVDCGTDSSLDNGADTTISVWVYPSTVSGEHSIAGKFSSSNNGYWLRQNTDDIQWFGVNNAVRTATNVLSANSWHHIVGVRNGTILTIYVAGEQSATGDAGGSVNPVHANPFIIGRRSDSSAEYFNGPIDDVRILNRALLSSEIKAVYHDSLQGYPRTLRRMGRVIFPAAVAVGFAGKSHIIGGGMVA